MRKLLNRAGFIKPRILAINGSPRRGGNTDIIVGRILQAAKAAGALTDEVVLNNLELRPCQSCDEPDADGNCVFKDGMDAVYKKLKEADAVVLASPIFFGSLSGQAKIMVDRFQCAWKAKYILGKDLFPKKKAGAFAAIAASDRKDFFNNAKAIVKNLFATLNIDYKEEIYFTEINAKAEILKHPRLLKMAGELGKNMVKIVTKEKRNG